MAGQDETCNGLGCPYWHEAEERMDIIGSNGNDGEHYQPKDYPVNTHSVLTKDDYNGLVRIANNTLDETDRAVLFGILRRARVE